MRVLYLIAAMLCASVVVAQDAPKPNAPASPADAKAAENKDSKPADAKTDAADATTAADAGKTDTPKPEGAETKPEDGAPPEKSAEELAKEEFWKEVEKVMHSGALGYMIDGGLFMWPIFFLGIVAVGVILERYRSLRMLGTDTGALRGKVVELLRADNVEEALKLCDSQQGPVPAVLACGLRKYLVLRRLNYDPGKIEEQVIKSMDDYSVHIVAALERHLPILATVASAAPMIGFLGTVQGMVVSFSEIQARIGTANIVELAAGGIKVALLTTCLGLIVGIPAYVFYNYFTGVINRYVLDVEESASELIESVTLQMALGNK